MATLFRACTCQSTSIFDYTILDVFDEKCGLLRLVTYVSAPGTGTRAKVEAFLSAEGVGGMGGA